MDICEDGHDEIVYNGILCPMCELITDHNDEISGLNDEISGLNDEISGLNDTNSSLILENDNLDEQIKVFTNLYPECAI